jgi:glycosyltransferase involved in cell wall biosynthesis
LPQNPSRQRRLPQKGRTLVRHPRRSVYRFWGRRPRDNLAPPAGELRFLSEHCTWFRLSISRVDNRCVAVLGQADTPTDAVEEYCRYLASALAWQGFSLEIVRVRWAEIGWRAALQELSDRFPAQEDSWFLFQYTALAWSRRGFSWRFLQVLRHLKQRGARCAIVFHDAETYFGTRLIDRGRRAVQLYTMRNAWRSADLSIFTIPPEKIPWLSAPSHKTAFIPVGANLPSPELAWQKSDPTQDALPTVAIFSLSPGPVGAGEIRSIADAALFAAERIGPLRLLLLGRNSEIAETSLREKLGTAPVEVMVRGILPADEIVRSLSTCDAMLFVRGAISTRRGSTIAGIACGLPVIAGQGWETASPLTEAGVVLVEANQPNNFGSALVRVLSDHSFRAQLAERSRNSYAQYFSWEVIASQFIAALRIYGAKSKS